VASNQPGREDARPETVADLPGNYAEIEKKRQLAVEKAKAEGRIDDDCPECPKKKLTPEQVDVLQKHNAMLRQQLSAMSAVVKKIGEENQRLIEMAQKQQAEAIKEQAKAWGSPLFFKVDDQAAKAKAKSSAAKPPTGEKGVAVPAKPGSSKIAFLTRTSSQEPYLKKPFLKPRSTYEIQAGTVIPAALLTGINTDLPGNVIAVVTAPVFDSVSGDHLLIPQGSRLYGSYDSLVGNGQNRALVAWDRLLLPSGRSIQLDRMAATDPSGFAGVADRVDYHVDRLIFGAALSAAIAWSGNTARSRGNSSDNDVGDTVAQEGSKIGSNIVERQLDVQPTITVRPGFPLRVMVNRDVILAPYKQ